MITREATVWIKSANPLSTPYVGLILPPEREGGESDTVTFWGEEFEDFNLGDRVNITIEKVG